MKLIWKKKLFWYEETDGNKLYIHPLLAFVSIAAAFMLGLAIVL